MAEHIGYRKPRPTTNNTETDPNSIRPRPTISSILLSSNPNKDNSKKKNFTSASFRGLGCTASSQVSVPAVIRTSADWETKKVKKKKIKTKKSSNNNNTSSGNFDSAEGVVTNNGNPLSQSSLSLALSSSCVGGGSSDVWCGPGIGLSTDAASVDFVVSRRPNRGKLDGRSVRRMVTPEDIPFLETETMPRFRAADISASRHHHRHARHSLREGLAEIVMLQSSLMMGGRLEGMDRYRELRLDVDNMSYEELLELGDSIGYVNTGLREDDMTRCLRRSKIATLDDLSSLFATKMEKKCTICQEEYEQDDETGKLNCGHLYHLECIKLWLGQKNICPICKTAAVSHN
ncbi:hypothetical protein ACJIZ3_020830 [Penstemon smallii]|uniref:RING-type E3 ubiquitin transferase n=1 Tax=Penstemon smallii TaxID=265156 RepID=A0ABD3SK53_9LAMI